MKKINFTSTSLLLLIAGIVLPLFMAFAKKATPVPSKADVEKSKYYTRQAFLYQDSDDAAYDLWRYALRLDTSNIEAGYNYAVRDWIVDTLDLNTHLLQRYADAYPADINELEIYALLMKTVAGDIEATADIYRNLLKVYPKRTDLYNDLADAYKEGGDIEAALAAVRTYERLEGISNNTTYSKVDLLFEQNDTPAMIAVTDTLVMARPDDPGAWILRSGLFNLINMPDSAEVNLLRAEALAPYMFDPKMFLADFYNEQGDTVRADAKMLEALNTNDRTVDEKTAGLADFVHGLLTNGNDYRRALPMIDALIAQEPDNVTVRHMKALLYGEKHKYAEQMKEYRAILEIDSTLEPIWGQLLMTYINAGDYAAMPAVYDEAMEALKESNPEIDLYMASGYSLDGKPDKAAALLRKTINRFLPCYTDSMNPQALVDSVEANRLRENVMANYLQMYGDQFVSMNDTTRGLRIYDQALALDPENYLTLNNYAYFLALGGKDLDRALDMSMKTINADAKNGTYLDTYAYILFRKHDYERARMYQEMAIECTEPENITPDLYEHYGDILFMLGEQDKALEYWKKALEKDPDSDILKRKVQHETYFYQ